MTFLLVLAACGGGQVRYAVPLPQAQWRVAFNVASLEVRDAGLPLYAGLEEIFIQQADGGLSSSPRRSGPTTRSGASRRRSPPRCPG